MLKLEFTNQRFDAMWVVDKQLSIGSGEGNHLVINDPSVSPQHARLITTSDGFLLKDSGSHQGTYVNGEAVTQARVKPDDLIRLGDVEFRLIDPFESITKIKGGTSLWALIACSSFLSGQEFPLVAKDPQSKSLILGRGKQCDIVFPGTHLSRQHVEITLQGDQLRLRDLNSANGTFINEQRITEGVAKPGDKIRLDIYTFKVLGPNNLPQSILPNNEQPIADPKAKQWLTRPTSPGNREEPGTGQNNAIWTFVGFGLLLAFLGIVCYVVWF